MKEQLGLVDTSVPLCNTVPDCQEQMLVSAVTKENTNETLKTNMHSCCPTHTYLLTYHAQKEFQTSK